MRRELADLIDSVSIGVAFAPGVVVGTRETSVIVASIVICGAVLLFGAIAELIGRR